MGLKVHQKLHPPSGRLRGHLPRHLRRRSAFLRGELEDTRPLNLSLPEELRQLFKLPLALAGEAADEGGPQHQPRQLLPQAGQQRQNLRLGGAAVHGLQNAVVDVLKG